MLQALAGRSESVQTRDLNATRGEMSRGNAVERLPARVTEAIFLHRKSKAKAPLEPLRPVQSSRSYEARILEPAIECPRAEGADKEDRLAMVVHDLRGPLTAIQMSTASLRRQVMGDPADECSRPSVLQHLNLVSRNVDRMAAMVTGLLDATARQPNGLTLDLARSDVDDLIGQALELHSAVAENKGVKLEFRQRHSDCTIDCDRDRILRVLSNLVDNAIKVTPPGGTVTIESTVGMGELIICLRDMGPGILPAHLPFIFEKYWRGRREGGEQGFGLGLAIVKEIVQAHEGRIWVESSPGQGCYFFFSIPRVQTMRPRPDERKSRGLSCSTARGLAPECRGNV